MATERKESAELYVRRLEQLESNIRARLSAIDRAAVAFPAVGVALVGITQRDDTAVEAQEVIYSSLVLLAAGLAVYAVVQMRAVFVYGGLRKAIEEYAESKGILPKGLFTWERGPALEISGDRRLDGAVNLGRYAQPVFLGLLDAGMCGYALVELQSFGLASVWFIVPSILAIVSLVGVLWAFREVPAAMDRVYLWTRRELADCYVIQPSRRGVAREKSGHTYL